MTSTTVKFLIFCALITLSAAVNAELKRINKHKEICPNSWENCFVTFDAAGTPTKSPTPAPAGNTTTTGKNVFPLTAVEVIGVILLIVIAGLANSGGVGGGPLLSSILMIFFSYSPNVSSQVVYTLVFGGSLGNYLNLVTRINPETRRPLIDYDLSLLCMPPMVFGANIGILIERVTAPLLLIIGIVTVTSYSFYQILRNALDLFKRESKRKARIKEANERGETLALADAISRDGSFASEAGDDKQEPLIENKEEPETSEEKPVESSQNAENAQDVSANTPHKEHDHVVDVANVNKEEHELDEDAKKFIRGETTLFPAYKYAIMLLLLFFVMGTAYLKGTDEFPSSIGVAYCSAGYWGLFLASLVSCVICFFLDIKLINSLIEKRVKYRHVFKQHPFKLTRPIVAKLTIASLIAGFLAGWLGIGGGMIMKPTLLNVGVATQTVSSTAGFFVLQTSFVTLFQALLYQDISYTDQAFFFVVSFVGSFMVSWTLNWLIKKYKRPSIILFALIFVLFISILATPIFEVSINLHHMSQMTQFGTFC